MTLTRTQKPGDSNAYVVVPLHQESTPTEQRFTKLASQVPIEVSEALGIYPEGINFAGQHDMPFMLSTTGTQNANALGRLTNVHTIFEAAREANRQRTQSSSTLRTRQEDIESIRASLDRFKNLPRQRAAAQRAEDELKRAHMLSSRLDRLRYLRDALVVTSRAIPSLRAAATRDLPSTSDAEKTSEALDRFHALRGRLIGMVNSVQQAQEAVRAAGITVDALTDARAGVLSSLSADIERAMIPHAVTHESIQVPVAARISAEYIRDVL